MSAGASALEESRRARLEASEYHRLAEASRAIADRYALAGRTEGRVAGRLAALEVLGWQVLADRRWAGSKRANVDVLLVGPGGVVVVDVKAWAGLEVRGDSLFCGEECRDDEVGKVLSLTQRVQDAVAVLDAFHVVKLGTAAVDECRRRIQQETLGHRGRKGDPLYGIQTILRAGAENLTEKQRTRLAAAIEADPAHDEVFVAWQCAQQLRSAYHAKDLTEGRRIAERVVDTFHTCPIPEIARLGRTLRRWRSAFLAYFTTSRANNGGTEAINGIIELHRRLARGYRNRENYRLRMLLTAGGLTP